MRTDVKVGLICVFAIILGVVIYFVAQGNTHPQLARGGTPAATGIAPAGPSAAPATAPSVTTLDVAPAGNNAGTLLAAAPPAGQAIGGGLIVPPSAPSSPIIPSGSTTTSPASTIPSVTGITTPALGGGLPMTSGSIIPATGPAHTGALGGSVSTSDSSFGSGSMGGTGHSTIDIDTSSRPPVPSGGSTFTFGSGSNFSSGLGGSSSAGSATTYTLQKGDMLGSIAKKYHVTTKAIEAANPGIDSTRLKIGKSINIPAPSASTGTITPATTRPAATRPGRTAAPGSTAARAPKPGTSYTLKKGDTLSKLAVEVYGNKAAWQKIFRANRGEIADANSIPVGTVIKLPN